MFEIPNVYQAGRTLRPYSSRSRLPCTFARFTALVATIPLVIHELLRVEHKYCVQLSSFKQYQHPPSNYLISILRSSGSTKIYFEKFTFIQFIKLWQLSQ